MDPDRQPFPFPSRGNPPHAGDSRIEDLARADVAAVIRQAKVAELPTEEAIDRGIEETFPASDPVAVVVEEWVDARSPQERLLAYWRAHQEALVWGASLGALAWAWWRTRRR